jgi:lysophospholipase L1-like esterase
VLSHLLYAIYSGQLFFAAAALLLLVIALDSSRCFKERPLARRLAGFSALLALALAIFSAPPAPWTLSVTALASTTFYLFRSFGTTPTRHAAGVIAAVAIIVMVTLELPYHFARTTTPQPTRIVVIGDSLSSGGFGETYPWPMIIAEEMDVDVMNLSLPSAHVADAIERQLPDLPSSRNVTVILAIGGNDMLEGTSPQRFAADLERLIATARGQHQRRVIMLELPLLPGRWSYGKSQRRLAREYGCVLLPKRILAATLAEPGNTIDGIHLTQQGHADLARRIMSRLQWPPAATSKPERNQQRSLTIATARFVNASQHVVQRESNQPFSRPKIVTPSTT